MRSFNVNDIQYIMTCEGNKYFVRRDYTFENNDRVDPITKEQVKYFLASDKESDYASQSN
jgi:hypothetical protein